MRFEVFLLSGMPALQLTKGISSYNISHIILVGEVIFQCADGPSSVRSECY